MPPTLTHRLRTAWPRLPWYLLAVGFSALALVLMVLLGPLMEHSVFFLFLAAVIISALYGGLGPGLTATALSVLASTSFFPESYEAPFGGPDEVLRVAIFLATGVTISWLADGHKRAEESLRERNEYLELWTAQRKDLERRLEYRATHDHLTDLRNQTSFYEHLSHAIARARRRSSKVAVLFVDLDDFKLVNDSLGHLEGNRVLRAVAERLRESLREADVSARFGGDEFVLLVEDVVEAREALRVAERVQERLRMPFDIGGGRRVHASASIGIALGTEERPQELVRAADEACYRAKRLGKARSVVSSPDSASGGVP